MNIPYLKMENGFVRLFVDDKPFFILGLQLDCDSCYEPETIITLMKEARRLGCNSVALLLYWRLIEPSEGNYDFGILDVMLDAARELDLRIVLVWFGGYKNGCMNYTPRWVFGDHGRFERAYTKGGESLDNIACPTCETTLKADKAAVCAVFRHLSCHDDTRRVILFQINNEIGVLGTERCYCPRCNSLFDTGRYEALESEPTQAFCTDSFLSYHERIAEDAKLIYPLPCYLNAWLSGKSPAVKPGQYPAGGPEERALPRYLQKKRNVDFVSPDIYGTSFRNFHATCRAYTTHDNPLYVAEHGSGINSRAEKNVFYCLEYGAIGFDPWAIDCSTHPSQSARPMVNLRTLRWSDEAYELHDSYVAINDAMEIAARYGGTDKMQVWVQEEGENRCALQFDDIWAEISYVGRGQDSRGFIARINDKTFIVAGCSANLMFVGSDGIYKSDIQSLRGVYVNDKFAAERVNRREGTGGPRPVRLSMPGAYQITIGD
ncbi:MAG: beta-galactosidase [Oscillospiraceae bacterium]|nr:beta-galactosidase [Oscillospiraceae bacterium]